MCGIAGILDLKGQPVQPDVLAAMTRALGHRGPDGDGLYAHGPVGLGHRRLAILDLTPAAAQPMQSGDGRFILTYNGEIYNFQELRRELANLGHHFVSRSDTEVVLAAYAQWGKDCLSRFNGMFALALWDNRDQTLFLARDRYGIKPLYHALVDSKILFGSEIKALLAHPSYQTDLDREALLEYFTFQNIFTDKTLFRGVRLFPAGCYAILRPSDTAVTPVRYWDYDFAADETLTDPAACAEELDRLFRQAVQRQLVSDVEVGAFLSGGMDSGSLTAAAVRARPHLKTFTCGFDLSDASGVELAFDERGFARALADHLGTDHYDVELHAGDMERVIPALTKHLEDPRVGQSYPNYYAAELAARHVKVVLSGCGGDELFAGYPWRYYRAMVNDDFENYVDKYYLYWQRLLPNAALSQLFKPIWNEVRHVWTRDIFRDVFTHHAVSLGRPEDYINHSLYFEAKTFLHGLLLVEDKLSMAHGVELRLPFLDNDLVDFAMRIPVSFKLANIGLTERLNENDPGLKTDRYFSRTRDGKIIFRELMQRYIPAEVVEREKQGFSAPDASWFKGKSLNYVRERLFDPKARLYRYFDRATLTGLVDDHLTGRQNRRLLIWSLLNFEQWLECFLT